MLLRRYQPAAVFGLTPKSSANFGMDGHLPMSTLNVIERKASTKRTVLQVRNALFVETAARDKMYDVSKPKKTRRQAYTEHLAGRVEAIRAGLGIEPKEMAKRLKLKFETYRAYEEGRRMMPPYVMVDLARVSGHGPWFILTGEPEQNAPEGGPDTSRLKALRT